MGLSGNLSMGEILEQIIHADRVLAKEWNQIIIENCGNTANPNNNQNVILPKLDLIRNVVFMGMGEVRNLCDMRYCNMLH
jgi:adenine C2-methylase RlmN of 23S rRNA A2503 and tRNA A37